MNILLVGSGGREHAIAWKLAQSKKLSNLYIAPGNPGTAECGVNLPIDSLDFLALKNAVLSLNVEMVIVGPEEPLVKGLYDFFKGDNQLQHVKFIGPSKEGAMLEGSKDFAKAFMIRHGIPTAAYKSFKVGELDAATQFLRKLTAPYVIKADGLAAGKGVVITSDISEANSTIEDFFNGRFGDASKTVVIEEYLAGIELSVFVLTDGISYLLLPEAKDYKRIGVGDTGPNTGGMGAISPVSFATTDFMKKVEDRIIKPTIDGIRKEKIEYCGFIFFGLMNVAGDPFVIEYNARLGDPETEVVLPRIENDLIDMLDSACTQNISSSNVEISKNTATTVILVSGGYPGNYKKGFEISGINQTKDVLVFQAGTKNDGGSLVTSGGRVLALTGLENSMDSALEKSYQAATIISYEGKYYRNDIGNDLIK